MHPSRLVLRCLGYPAPADSRMNTRKSAVVALALLSFVGLVSGQDPTTKEVPRQVHDLAPDIERGNPGFILEAGRTGLPDFIPILRGRLKRFKKRDKEAIRATRMALARLGDTESLQMIYCEIEATNYDGLVDATRQKLPYVGGWFALEIADGMVDGRIANKVRIPWESQAPDDLISDAKNLAMTFLRRQLPDMSKGIDSQHSNITAEIGAWKSYLETHREQLMALEPQGKSVKFSRKSCR